MSLTYTTELKFVASAYAKLLKATVTGSTIENEIEKNPYFPSLYSLAHIFSKYKINNNAYNISPGEFDLYEVEAPFVAYVKLMGNALNDFVLVTDMDEEFLSLVHGSNKKQKVSKEVFLGRTRQIKDDDVIFKGTIFKAELTEHSGDLLYRNKKIEENKSLVKNIIALISTILLITLAIGGIAPVNSLLTFTTIVLIKLIGLFAAGLILVHDNDKSNAFIKNICSIGSKTNCDAVLSSAAAKIVGVNMGEVGLIYFSSTLIGLFLPNLDFTTKLFFISAANVIVVPYIFFSVYYQWKVVKNWCPLCLTVQAVFLSEFIWSIALFWKSPYTPTLAGHFVYTILFCIGVPIIIWYYLKPRLTKAMNHDLYYAAYERIQFNPDIFDKLLTVQPTAPTGWETIGIDVGSPAAEHVLIKVCSPYCNPCSEAHSALHKMLENNNNIRLKIIFVTRNTVSDRGRPVVMHLLALAESGIQLQKALDAWYLNPEKNYDEFAAKYPVNVSVEQQEIKIEAMRKWCDAANIAFTPTIFLDGYLLPENYSIENLANVL